MKGRRPKPTALKILQGNPGRGPLNMKEPQLTPGKPEKPEDLGSYGSEMWDELVEELLHIRVLTMADRRALEMACRAYQEYRENLTKIDDLKRFRAVSDAWKRIKSMLVEFGLTPSSRSKIQTVAPPVSNQKKFFTEFRMSDREGQP